MTDTSRTFANRFDASNYDTEGNLDAIWLDGLEGEGTTVLPFVFERLTGIGQTYELHHLTSLTYDEDNRLNPTQCEGLLAEIEFVVELVDDPLLRAYVDPVRAAVISCIRSAPSRDLIISIES